MYWGVADTDSDEVFLELAPDDQQRSLVVESASSASAFAGPISSTTSAWTAPRGKRGWGVDRLPGRSKSPRTGPSRRPSPRHRLAASRLCLPPIAGRETARLEPTAYALWSSPQAEFSFSEAAQEIG
jgi:hypothetical protein